MKEREKRKKEDIWIKIFKIMIRHELFTCTTKNIFKKILKCCCGNNIKELVKVWLLNIIITNQPVLNRLI